MTVYKDKERNSYYFVVRVPDPEKPNKTKQVKRRGFKSKKEATLAEAETMMKFDKLKEENEVDEENVSFEFIAKEYLSWYEKYRKASSLSRISGVVNQYLIPKFGKKKLHQIKARDISRYQDELVGSDKNYSVAHIKKIHTVLSAVFNHAVKFEYTKENPARIAGNVDLPDKKRMDYWTLDEFREFMSVVDEPFYYALFMALYYSGMRKGELLALTWGDIDFENNQIDINKTVYNRQVTTPKTANSVRKIFMPQYVIRLLSQLKASRTDVKMTYVVFGEFHDHLSTSTLDRKYENYVTKAKVKKIRLHDFRHSHASYLINNSTIVSVVAARLGHGDVATTLNTYSHLYPTTEKEAVLHMENDFKQAEIIKFYPKNG